jgi:hypothetical protein
MEAKSFLCRGLCVYCGRPTQSLRLVCKMCRGKGVLWRKRHKFCWGGLL